MFAYSLEYYLLLLWDPSINIDIFYSHQKYRLKDTYKIFKNSYRFKAQILIKLETSSIQGFITVAPWYPPGNNLSKHAGSHSVTTEVCTSFALVCVVWTAGSSLQLSALWPLLCNPKQWEIFENNAHVCCYLQSTECDILTWISYQPFLTSHVQFLYLLPNCCSTDNVTVK